MSDAEAPAPTQAPRNSYWRGRAKSNPLPAEQAKRQGEITKLAFVVLGREEALAFLNSPNEALDGRPLDLATASAEGLSRVEAQLSALAYRPEGGEDDSRRA